LAPGIVYLVVNQAYFAMKIGMTTTTAREGRVEQHLGHGWKLVRLWNVPTGDDAEAIEYAVLNWWRKELLAPPALSKTEMSQGGWSETASLLWVDLDSTVAFIEARICDLKRGSTHGC